MNHACLKTRACFVLLLAAWAATALGQISVTGLTDQKVYTNRVSLKINTVAGYRYSGLLNGSAIPVGFFVTVTQPNYYELLVSRYPSGGGTLEELLIRFIVVDGSRGICEAGLPLSNPLAAVHSASEEWTGVQLEVIAPGRFPVGLEIPMVFRARESGGGLARLNGIIEVTGDASQRVRLRRGHAADMLPAATTAGPKPLKIQVQTLEVIRSIEVEPAPAWTVVSGTLPPSTVWGENARIQLAADTTVPAGGTLTIGPGSVIQMGAGVELTVDGVLQVNGTSDRPAAFVPAQRSQPWGGMILRTAASRADLTWAILTGGGADRNWAAPDPWSSHRPEQPVLYLANGARATLTDCFLVNHAGQAGHGENAFLTMRRCLVQKVLTGGQYNGGSVVLADCALLEFPEAQALFADAENDGLHLTGGDHYLTNCVVGWALDDGVDAGGGAAGSVTLVGCWLEACYHEGIASSGSRNLLVRDTVVLNCGQAIEAGFGSPNVVADNVLCAGNLVGTRFGDSYDTNSWSYEGFLRVTNALLLFNERNVWGFTRDAWMERLNRMDVQGNFLSQPDTNHVGNTLWEPASHGAKLRAFRGTLTDRPVGIGFATPSAQFSYANLPRELAVGLSSFSPVPVQVEYTMEGDGTLLGSGTLEFVAGQIVQPIPIEIADPQSYALIKVRLHHPAGASLSGQDQILFAPVPSNTAMLVSLGSEWKYWDFGSDRGVAWRELDYDDTAWRSGPAQLGFGGDGEVTLVDGGPPLTRYPTIYFRHRFVPANAAAITNLPLRLKRDDGAVVYLNGFEVLRDNMPAGPIDYSTRAQAREDEFEDVFHAHTLEAGRLVTGTNLLAVEVHQYESASSDLSFDLELSGRTVAPLQIWREDDRLVLFWLDESFVLQEAETVAGPWRNMIGYLSPTVVAPANRCTVYRLMRP